MLRTIEERHQVPRMLAYRGLHTGGGVTPEFGALHGAYSSAAVGVQRLVLGTNYHRAPVVVASQDNTIAGGYPLITSGATITQIDIGAKNHLGAAVDTRMHSIMFGWMSDSTDLVRPQRIRTVLDRPRYLGLEVVGGVSPSLAIGSADASITRLSAGRYQITYTTSFGIAPSVVGISKDAALSVEVETASDNVSAIISLNTAGQVATDGNFYLHVMGTDSVTEHARLWRAVKATHLKPRLIPLQISVAAGTPSLSVGGDYGTVTDLGVGNFRVTLTDPAFRNLIPVATADDSRTYIENVDTDSFELVHTLADGSTANDPGSVNCLALAYYEGNEYYQG